MTIGKEEIDKYLQGVMGMMAVNGLIDSLRIYNNQKYQDDFVETNLNQIMDILHNISGAKYTRTQFVDKKQSIQAQNNIYELQKKQDVKQESNAIMLAKVRQEQATRNIEKYQDNNIEVIYDVDKKTRLIHTVNSSLFDWVMYNQNTHHLDIGYKKGEIYRYYRVEEYHMDNIIALGEKQLSMGSYINKNIVKGKYTYQKITDDILIG